MNTATWEHYGWLAASMLSNKIWDTALLLVFVVFNFAVWETRIYHNQADCEKLLEYVAQTYWLCTHCRTALHNNNVLVPTGYVVGQGWYLVQVDVIQASAHTSHNKQRLVVTVYGWWSIDKLCRCFSSLSTTSFVCPEKPGVYKLIGADMMNPGYVRSYDEYDEDKFHLNCRRGTELILQELRRSSRFSGVFFLYGDPGLGKTTTARYLSKVLQGWLCLDFEELYYSRSRPVYEMDTLLQYVQPDRAHPLVVVLDEVDEFLFRSEDEEMYVGDNPVSKEAAKLKWKNKNTKKNWSRLLDMVQQHRNIILLLTSNRSKAFFDNVDPALLREYRVSMSLEYLEHGVIPSMATVACLAPMRVASSFQGC